MKIKKKKKLLSILILLIILFYSTNIALAGTATCTNDCTSDADCGNNGKCVSAACENGAKDFVYVCLSSSSQCGTGYTLQGDACVPTSSTSSECATKSNGASCTMYPAFNGSTDGVCSNNYCVPKDNSTSTTGTATTSGLGSGPVASSQCTGINVTTGGETGCTHANDTDILNSQCRAAYPDTANMTCSSMSSYLTQMQADCQKTNPDGINCSLIDASGVYGTQASAFASTQGTSTGTTPTAGAGAAGMLNIPQGTGLADPAGGIGQILGNLLNWLLGIIGIIALIAFIISGLQYFMAAGNENTMQTAKRNMTYAIIGVIVALSGFIVIQAIDTALRASSINF